MFSFPAGIQHLLSVLGVAATPVLELRAAIPLALAMGFSPLEAYLLGVAGSLFPVPFLLLALKPLTIRLRKRPRFRRFVRFLYGKARGARTTLDRYGLIGLVLLVAIPLPSTGAWTGSIAASLLGFRFWSSLAAIAIGTALAGAIVTLLFSLGLLATS